MAGGSARADDEFRIQFTGAMPRRDRHTATVLLGWHDGYEVFAAWDIARHDDQTSKSPSAQVKEEALRAAHDHGFATYERQTGEVVITFRREFIGDYVRASSELHRRGAAGRDFLLLNNMPDLTDREIANVANKQRRWVIATIVRRYRAADFRKRVLTAYGHRCAVCGIQLNLIEAAHIDPVTAAGSTDETANGIALCALHHLAYDRSIISIDEQYNVQVSQSNIAALSALGRGEGAKRFKRELKPVILLPADRRDYPKKRYLRCGRLVRGWTS